MNGIFLKLRILVFLTMLMALGVQAQNPRNIYIQAENKQPFYVKVDKNILSSSVTGHIIIPELSEIKYDLLIGFPQNEWPELKVTVNVKDSDADLLLKKSDTIGWHLVNVKTKLSLTSGKQGSPIKEIEVIPEVDEFARILAQVVNDPSIVQVKEIKNVTGNIAVTEDKKTLSNPNVIEEMKPVVVNISNKDTAIEITEISKLNQDYTSEGLLITYLDMVNTGSDTVKVFIPAARSETINEEKIKTQIPDTIINKENSAYNGSKFLDMELQNPNAKIDSGAVIKKDFVITEKKDAINDTPFEGSKSETTVLDSNKVMMNSVCKKTATENDFLELRKYMAAETSEKEMLKTANKQFDKTCFTTEQVKNLGVLFISEEERYNFYIAAFPFVTDTVNFAVLEQQLTDNNYKRRFKAMLGY